MTDFALQQHHAGGASAQDCPWFTDNPLIENWYRRNSTDDVYVVLVETGTFTGAYVLCFFVVEEMLVYFDSRLIFSL